MTEPNRQSGENEERIIEIEIERLRPFKEHPFQVKDKTRVRSLIFRLATLAYHRRILFTDFFSQSLFVLGFTFIDCGIFPVFIKIAGFVCAFWLSLQLGFLNYREFFPELYSGASEYDHHEYPQHQLGVQCVASFLFRTDGAIVDFSQCAWRYQ